MLGSAATGSPRTQYPCLPPAWVSQNPRISCSFNPILSERKTDALRDLHEGRVQIQSWTPGAVPTRKRKGNSFQQPQEQRIKSPQSTWCTHHLWHTWIDNKSSQIEEVDFGSKDIYILFPFSLFVSVYVYASVWDFVCIALLLPFVLGFLIRFFFSIVFSACYHWWICFLVSLLSSFFLSFFFFITLKKFLIIIFYFNYFISFYFILFYFIFFLSFFLLSLLFWAVWVTGSWCFSQVSGLCLWGGRAKFRTLVHKRPPSSK